MLVVGAALVATGIAPGGVLAAPRSSNQATATADETRAVLPNDPFMAFGWPYKLAGVVGQSVPLYASAFSVQLGFDPVVRFSSNTPSVCSITGSTVRFAAPGDCGIHLVTNGDQFYAAGAADVTYTVGTQEIFLGYQEPVLPAGSTLPLRGQATSGLPVHWEAPSPWIDEDQNESPNACTVIDTPDGPAVQAGDAPGMCGVIATQPGGAGWAPADAKTQLFPVGPGYAATWSVTAPDTLRRTDGTIQTGDLLSVTYTAEVPIDTCDIAITARLARASFPGILSGDKRSCRFSYTIPQLPPAVSHGASACDGPFGNMIDCDMRPEVCVAAALGSVDGLQFGMAVEDRLTPYEGHCPSTWEDGKAAQQPADMLNFLDTQPGPAAYTFTSEPQVLSWDTGDWGSGDLNFGYNRLIHLQVPAWVEACGRVEIGIPPVGHWYDMEPGPCPTWDIRVPAQSAGYPGETTGYVAVNYTVGGLFASVLSRQVVDTTGQDLDGEFASTLPALMPLTPSEEYLDGAATTWEPDFRVFGSAIEPTACTLTLDNPANPDEPIVLQRAETSGFDCHFSVPIADLGGAIDGLGCRASFTVTAAFLDDNQEPVREELFESACVRPRQPSVPPQVEAIRGARGTLVGAGAVDPTAVHVDVAVGPVGEARSAVAATLNACSASRSRNVTDAALDPAYVTCDLPVGSYVATSTSYNASGGTSATVYPFSVTPVDGARPSVTAPVAAIRSGAALSGTAIPLRLTWTGADNPGGSGVARYQLARSVNGGAWATVSTSVTAPWANVSARSSGTVRYRVRAIDAAGNTSAWAYGRVIRPRLVQQAAGSIRYVGHWRTYGGTRYSGGSAARAAIAGMAAVYSVRATSVGLVTRTGPARGKARVFVNGGYRATLDLRRATTAYRVVAWSQAWPALATRTIRVAVQGTAGRPTVEVDAFVVLR